jgi:NMD protein affecting ribosome stability and mRNA decay
MIGRLLCAVGLHWREPTDTTIATLSHVRVAIKVPVCTRCGRMSRKDARHVASLYQLGKECAAEQPLQIIPTPKITLKEHGQ